MPSRLGAGVAGLLLVLTGCGGVVADDPPSAGPGCAAYARYGDLTGRSISLLGSLPESERASYRDSFATFETCTGARVVDETSAAFEADLLGRVRAGRAPDLAVLPRPGLLRTLVRDTGGVKPAPAQVATNVDQYFPATHKSAGSVDGTLYAAPLGAEVRSFVWYSPRRFAQRGYPVPASWDEMLALSDRIVADGGTPWCAGALAPEATGSPLATFVEDAVLREAGPEGYDRWVTHAVPFDAPEIGVALGRAGALLRNPAYTNGGIGDVSSIATTPVAVAGLPILDGTCALHHQAGSYAARWPEGTDVSENGAVYAFLTPPTLAGAAPAVLVGGEFVAAFSERPEVQAFQAYLSSPEWATEKAKVTLGGGWTSANTGLDPATLAGPIDRLSAEILQDPRNVLRVDGTDLMPPTVGAGSFPAALTDWVTGRSTEDPLTVVERSWPR
jgi:ABC-type sugar transport system, periplasmic component